MLKVIIKKGTAMKDVQIFDNLGQVRAQHIGPCVVLFSGGIDGSYLLSEAGNLGIQPIALTIGVNNKDANPVAERNAGLLNSPYFFQNRTEELVTAFIAWSIRSNAYYRGFPISSSFSRPLIARAGVEFAHRQGIACIAHTSIASQNSAARFNLSLMALDPAIQIAAPFLRSQVSREEKMERLATQGLYFRTGIYSVDENIWARVIECGTLEDPENDLPSGKIFEWTREIDEAPAGGEVVEIAFENGLPISLNGSECSLLELIQELNARGGSHGVGRSSGLEDTLFGVKNHEVREAPAAHILLTAHRDLESAILTRTELNMKAILDQHFADLAVAGLWYSDAMAAAMAYIERLNTLINGSVRLRLHRGNLTILSRRAAAGLYYTAFRKEFTALVEEMPMASVFKVMGLTSLHRNGQKPINY
jgi:argininosuccinate synthase